MGRNSPTVWRPINDSTLHGVNPFTGRNSPTVWRPINNPRIH